MKQYPQRIGLTGGIGSGKTTVADHFRLLGAEVLDADAISRGLLLPDGGCYRAVIDAFGPDILLPDGMIDRKLLAKIVFSEQTERERLNAIVHPAVDAALREKAQAILAARPNAIIILDVPLLFECGMQKGLDASILVYALDEVRIRRVVARDGCTEEAARLRMAAQMPQEEKRALADFILDNSGTLTSLYAQADALYRRLTKGREIGSRKSEL